MRRFDLRTLLIAGVLSAFVSASAPAGGEGPATGVESASRPRLVAQLGHQGEVDSVAFSPDGKQVLTGSDDNRARLWDAGTGDEIREFEGEAGAFSPNGKQVLTGSHDATARLWDAATGKEIRRFEGHAGPVYSVAFSLDGAQVLTHSLDKAAQLWDAATGKEIREFEGDASAVWSVALSSDGKRVLTGGGSILRKASAAAGNTARLWDAATGKEIRKFDGHTNPINSVAFSPDGKQVLTGSQDTTARLWDAATGKEIRKFEGRAGSVWSVAFSPDGKHVLTGNLDHTALLWDVATGKEIRRFEGHKGAVRSIAFSSDGEHVLTGSDDKTARLWDAATGKEIQKLQGHAAYVTSVAFSSDGKQVLTGGGRAARLWDAANGNEIRKFEGHANGVESLAFSPDGKQVLAGSLDPTARLWDAATGNEIREFYQGGLGSVHPVAFSPDGKDVLTGSGSMVGTAKDNTARLWNAATGREIHKFQGHTRPISSVAFSRDGKQVLTGSDDRTARLWDAATGKEIRKLQGHTGWILSVAFSPDGAQVLTGSEDKTARLWDAATGREISKFEGHADRVTAVAFSPDGKQVLTGSWDETARLWDAATGMEIGKFEGHAGWVTSVAFSPDGRRFLSGQLGGTTVLWKTDSGEQLCVLVSFTNGDWAVVDPEGRFDGSNGGDVDGLHWVVGNEPIALSQLKERYYDPGLLAKKMGLNHEPLRNVAAFDNPKMFPEVKLTPPVPGQTRFDIHLANRGGGIGRVVVKINGKELTADARGARPDPNAAMLTIPVELAGDPRLKPGQKNIIEVQAFNAEEYLRSRGIEFEVDDPRDAIPEKPDLWALVVGVSRYQGGAINLRYPAKDAKDFAGALRIAAGRLFGADRFHIALLASAESDAGANAKAPPEPGAFRQPSRQNILAALNVLQDPKRIKPSDIVVVYLAGHGVTRSGADEGFYYLTCDAQNAELTDPAVRQQWAISDQELTAAIANSPAGKQVMILDTCHSGKLIEDMTAKRDISSSEVRALERIKDRTGLHILAGCASDAGSYEASRYGQGVLTYSLLLGMRGGRLKEDRFVDVEMLFDFAADKVPALAQNVGGIQRPVISSPNGESFEIGEVTADDRKLIPLQSERPLVLRTYFHDENDLDPLNLSDQMDELLRDASSRGQNPPLEFVDARKMPDAYHVAGSYHVAGQEVTVKVRLNPVDKLGVTFDQKGKPGEIAELAEKIAQEIEKRLSPPQLSP